MAESRAYCLAFEWVDLMDKRLVVMKELSLLAQLDRMMALKKVVLSVVKLAVQMAYSWENGLDRPWVGSTVVH